MSVDISKDIIEKFKNLIKKNPPLKFYIKKIKREEDNKKIILLNNDNNIITNQITDQITDQITEISRDYEDVDIFIEDYWLAERNISKDLDKEKFDKVLKKQNFSDIKFNRLLINKQNKSRIHKIDIRDLFCNIPIYEIGEIFWDNIEYNLIQTDIYLEDFKNEMENSRGVFIMSFLEHLQTMTEDNKKLFDKQYNKMDIKDKNNYKYLVKNFEDLIKNIRVELNNFYKELNTSYNEINHLYRIGNTDFDLKLNNFKRKYFQIIEKTKNSYSELMNIYTIGRMLKLYVKIGIYYGEKKHLESIERKLEQFRFLNYFKM